MCRPEFLKEDLNDMKEIANKLCYPDHFNYFLLQQNLLGMLMVRI